ncbi:uncharacterized protein DNG_03408 [Cephalotrichum gorgonifer]|uniref:Zn(2)-C6 fungal-type domain-containing protein n=1 Tax=Cephalotrichum gorgonifer TaxID=2041049 RepID=A0AAE8SU89_9PEZI|nr:uncharacterized protein DNG_03408 [Cephalotrichum gorgonifer]
MDLRPLKRNRVPLSCDSCRASKQKCDRARPVCAQCLRKSHAHACRYTDRPERLRPGKGVAARLQRLEGMVREIMAEGDVATSKGGNADGGGKEGAGAASGGKEEEEAVVGEKGTVVSGRRATSYVGATHCMAILEDIEVLKSYFDDPEEPEEESPLSADTTGLAPRFLLFSAGDFRSKEDLLNILPEKSAMDRLIARYFGELTVAQHIVHKPTFLKKYDQFCGDSQNVPINWIALLFMVLTLGTIYAPPDDPSQPATAMPSPGRMAQIKAYRAAAGWALVYGRYTLAGYNTIPPLLLFVESEMCVNASNQMDSYVLLGVCVRLMLKVGLHRDPSKLPGISPFEGEMRRRMWGVAVTMDHIVSFHVGLPSIVQGIESDTAPPLNILDEDFDESCMELPPARPPTEYTRLSYPISKCAVSKVFLKIAAHSHALSPPSYAEVSHLDQLLLDTWARVPQTMKPRPLEESVGDHPHQILQRAGLAALLQKSRCVLHRRYLTEPILREEHSHSRSICLESALALLRYQDQMWEGMQADHVFNTSAWFISMLALYDFLLAATVVYICVRSPSYPDGDGTSPWSAPGTVLPAKEELTQLIKSHRCWTGMTGRPEFEKASTVISTMLHKLISIPDEKGHPEGVMGPPYNPAISDLRLEAPYSTSAGMAPSVAAPGSYSCPPQTPDFAGISCSMLDSDVDKVTDWSNLNLGLIGSSADLDWREFENLVTDSYFASAEAQMLSDQMATWLDMQSSELPELDFDAPGTSTNTDMGTQG